MADDIGKESPATDPKSAGKTGPVKPPVLEGTAKPAGPTKPADEPKPAPDITSTKRPEPQPAKPVPPVPPTPPRSGASEEKDGSAWLAGILGGLIGLGAAYGLAWFGLWPSTPAPTPTADPRLAQFGTAIPELQTVTNTLQDELATLNSRISGLETDVAALPTDTSPAPTDTALSEQVAALGQRVDSLSSAPTANPANDAAAEQNADAIASLRATLTQLQQDASDNAAKVAAVERRIDTLSETASAGASVQQGVIRLPLIFSGLETAFDNGRPYESELSALRQALPETSIPEALSASAANGLPRPDDVARRLDAAIPDMLAGRPVSADGTWQDGAMDWFRGVIAMRPTGTIDGDGPDAIISRLEAAIARRDFVAAETELTALPASMRSAAGTVADDVAALAAAQGFIEGLRAEVLTSENGA